MIRKVVAHKENDIIVGEYGKEGVKYDALKHTDLPDFISQECLNIREGTIIWYQDLRLYGEDIISLLYQMNFKDKTEINPPVKDMGNRSFKYVLSVQGNFYSITIRSNNKTLHIYNVDNLLANLRPEEIIKSWGNDKTNYLEKLTDAIFAGVFTLGGFNERKTPYTISMVATREWKKIEDLYFCQNLIDCKNYKAPILYRKGTLADYLRKSYLSGWNYLNTAQKQKEARGKSGVVYDCNSLYPFVMISKPMPWGEPNYFRNKIPGDIEKDENFYYFVRVKIKFRLKKGEHFPFMQKRGDIRYKFRTYLETSNILYPLKNGQYREVEKIKTIDGKNAEVYPEFILTKTDYEMLKRHYDIEKEEVIDGVYFRTARNIFKDYIKTYAKVKTDADREKDAGKRRIAKMMLNALSGTMAKKTTNENIVFFKKGVDLDCKIVKTESQSASYIHIGAAILAYAREITYEAACQNYGRFLYSDTDSLHLIGTEPPYGIEIDPQKIGAWKLEKTFNDACYFKQKSYCHRTGDRYNVTMAGLAYNYKILLEDILTGTIEEWGIKPDAEAGKYGGAIRMWRLMKKHRYNRWDPWGDPELYEDYTRDHEKLEQLLTDREEALDVTSMLQWAEYPNGYDYVEDFELKHFTTWGRLKY